MPLRIKDPATEAAVRRLAKLRGVTLTEAVRTACEETLAKHQSANDNLADGAPSAYVCKVKTFVDEFHKKHPMSPEPLPKEFYDEL
jgi:antitoxin VapB